MSSHGNLDTAIANEIARLRAEVTRLEKEKTALANELEQVQKENRDFATMAVDAQEQNIAATNLYVASHRLHATLDADEVLNVIKEILVELVGAEEFGVLLLEEKKKQLELVASEGVEGRLPSRAIPMGEGIIGEVTASREPFFFERDTPLAQEARLPMAAIPLTMNEEPVGVIVIYKLFDQKPGFSPIDHQVLELLAAHAATALASARLHGAVGRKLKTVEGFVQLMKSN
jgi:signal transduction protein with GAF and PtsI domain